MTATRWEHVRALFESACDLDDPDRTAFLTEACIGDETLRREVESLLLSSDRAPDFVDKPAATAFPDLLQGDEASALLGQRVGAYRLTRLLAAGGMGVVYLAERADDEYEHRVAIKLIKRRVVTAGLLRRFRAERQTLARLDHSHIARLLDGGVTPEGLPYLVMEHIDGEAIDRYCDAHRLTVRQRLELFRLVCGAVAYAHRNLVVHRDLKPGNILVTPEGVPKLVDFGIAAALEPEASRAETWGMMTPEYASPEQRCGEPVTTAGDIFSLGIVLHELLTGRRPPVDSVGEAGNTVVDRGRLAQDLDAIVHHALDADPTRRYAGAEQFSDDIRRHLESFPVLARRQTMRYRTGRFLRRHRAGVVAASALVLAVVGGVAATVAAQQRTQAEAEKVHRVNTFLRSMLASVDQGAVQGPDRTVLVLLDEATESLQSGTFDDQPDVEADLRMTIGMAYLELGGFAAAETHVTRALEVRRERLGDHDPLVAEALDGLGRLAKAMGRYDEAETNYRGALAIRAHKPGPTSGAYAETLNNLGVLLKTMGRHAAAREALTEALAVRRAVASHARAADARSLRTDVATTLTNLAAVLKTEGDYDAAEPMYREALGIFREVVGPQHYRVAVCLNNLALLLADTGRYAEAETLLREALAVRRRVFGERHRAVATGLKNLALVLAAQGERAEAEILYRDAADLERALPGNEQRLANTLTNLAELLASDGRLDEAERLAREALAIRRRQPSEPRVAGTLIVLGRIVQAKGDPAAAEPLLRESLERSEQTLPPGHPKIAAAREALTACLDASGWTTPQGDE